MRIDIENAYKDIRDRSNKIFKEDIIIMLLDALDLQVKDIPLKDFIEGRIVSSKQNPLHRIISNLPKDWFYDKDTLKKDIIKLLETEDNEDRLKEIQDILNR